MGEVHCVRVYEWLRREDGARDDGVGVTAFLVERLWPRGIRRDALRLQGWLKDLAPSTQLRHWFGHDLAKWEEFRRRYTAELDAQPQEWRLLVDARQGGDVTLLYSARDDEHNSAIALREYLLTRVNSGAQETERGSG